MQADEAAADRKPAPTPALLRRSVIHRAARRRFAILLGFCAALLPWCAAWWLVDTEAGLQFVAASVDTATRGQIRLEQPRGRLADRVIAKRFQLNMAGTEIDARQVDIAWRPSELFSGWVRAPHVRVVELAVTYSVSHEPSGPLNSIALPIGIQMDSIELGRFTLNQRDGQSVERLFGLSAASGTAWMDRDIWRFERIAGVTDWGPATLSGTLATGAPFAVKLQGQVSTRYDAHSIEARLAASGSLTEMTLDASAASETLKVEGQAGLRLFDPMPVVRVVLEGGVVDPRQFHPDAPKAALSFKVRLQPSLNATGAPEAARLAESRIEGPLEIQNAAPGAIDEGRLPIERLRGRLTFDASELIVKDLELSLPGGGRASGNVAWHPALAGENPIGRTDGQISFEALDPSRLHGALPRARLAGVINARAQPNAQGVEARLSDGTLRADLAATYSGKRIQAQRLRVGAGAMSADASGWLDLDAAQTFKLDVETRQFDPAVFVKTLPHGDLTGTLAANGRLAPRLALDAKLTLSDSHFAGMPVAGGGFLAFDGVRVSRSDLTLNALGNQLMLQGAFGAPGDRLALRIDAPHMDLLGQGFSGRLAARGSLGGTLKEPAGQLDLVATQLAVPNLVRVDAINLRGRLNEGRDGAIDVRFTLGGLRSAKTVDQIVRRAALTVAGRRSDHKITAEAEFPRGRSLALAAHGGLSDRLDWVGRLDLLDLDWNAELSLAETAELEFGPEHFRLGPTHLRGERASISLDATRWSPGSLAAKGSMTGLRLGLALNDAQQVVARGDSLQLGAEWDFNLQARANGQMRVFREAGDLVMEGDAPVALGLTEFEAILAANDDRLGFSASAAGERIGVISASATAESMRVGNGWRIARGAPLLGRARIEVPSVSWVGPLLDPNLRTEGVLTGDFSLSGTPDHPVASGAITGQGLGLALVEQGLRLGGGVLKARFDADRLYLDDLSFVSPSRARPDEKRIDYAGLTAEPGRANVTGEVELASGRGRFMIGADRLPILQRRDLWLMLSGSGEIATTWESMAVSGKISVPAGYVGLARSGAPKLDDDVVVRGRSTAQERPFHITADVEADLGNALYLHAFGVDTRLVGAIRLRGRPGEPLRATGRVETRDGQYDAYGQRLAIDEGLITFQGPLDNPTLAITALRKGLAVEAGVAIGGSAQRPKVRLVSDPNVPDAEKLSWIILGRAPGGNSDADGAILVAAAGALLGDQTSGLKNQISSMFGIDQIMIAQSENRGLGHGATSQVAGSATGFSSSSAGVASDSVAGQVLMIGKRLTRDINLSYEQSLTGSESIVKLTYALTRRISMVARAGSDNALDLHYSVSFR
ncbi:translocation/assembly module TamB domain-containing protein [Niveibacterium umoris]|uniref:Translocation and assembly module TamB n=1 Tax=Niveibacterium umoris TaxID=1193620 RepID=A0A840BS95_9RHOO|nr:translocation/assembly module TamB domain-containing protein [Niveibacterium umoris]MBB4014542.1 translocation and assembly module TamB [Niveibacterium umoris]